MTKAACPPRTETDLRRLQHELEVHQVELELQNEEFKQAKTQMETLLDQYATYYDFAPVAYYNLNREGVIRTGNFAGARLLGVEHSRLVNRPFGRFVAAADRRTFSAFLQKVFSGQTHEHCEVMLPKTKAQSRLVQIEGARSEGGQECRVVVFDITERRRAEAGLHCVNRALRTISSCNQVLVRAVTETELLNQTCQAVVSKGGYRLAWVGFAEPDELKTVRPVAFAGCDKGYLENAKITWADAERGRGPTGVAIRTGKPATCRDFLSDPHMAPWRDAAIRLGFASSAVMPLRMNGEVFGALSIYACETDAFDEAEMKLLVELADDLAYGIAALRTKLEHRRTEAALGRSETALTEAQRIARVGSWWMDSTTNEMVWTEMVYRMFGLDPAQAPPPYSEQHRLFTAESWQRFSTALSRTRETGTPFELDLETIRADGTKGWMLSRGGLMRNEQEVAVGVCGSVQDITERKDAEAEIHRLNTRLEQRVLERTAQLQAANATLEAFSYSVSHDLRAPLRHVTGFVELLKESAGPSLSETSLRHLTTIFEAAKRMGDLIDDLLAFARVGQAEMRTTEVNLDELVRETLGDFKADTAARKIVWKINPLPAVGGDRALLRLVLVNLISNAVKFTGHRATAEIEIGEVKTKTDIKQAESKNETPISACPISAGPPGDTVIFIRDNGAGFDPQYAGKLFGVFQRLHSQEDFAGTGIGLANVQRIIHRHGGRVWAEGAVDGGATFYFSLPKQNGGGHEH